MNTLLTNSIAEVSLSYSSKIPASERIKITHSSDAEKAFRLVFKSIEHREFFYVMLLNRANRAIGIFQLSMGGITSTVVDLRILFQAAIKANASQIIMAHNHPSGQLKPSETDIALTKRIKSAGEILDIAVLDHLILTADSFYSFADEGQI